MANNTIDGGLYNFYKIMEGWHSAYSGGDPMLAAVNVAACVSSFFYEKVNRASSDFMLFTGAIATGEISQERADELIFDASPQEREAFLYDYL
jgi:hypothetical protein